MTIFSSCASPTCAVTVEGAAAQCPKCGGPMRLMREGRVRGWLLIGLGLFLVLFMAAIATTIVPPMLRPGEEIGGTTFTGTADQARLAIGLFAVVILFGLTSIAYGIFLIRTGRQSAMFIAATLGLALLLLAIGWAISGAMG